MLVLKKLIIKEWLKSFCGALAVLFMLIFVANVISEVLRNVTSLDIILKHHILEMPKWFNKIFPVACLTATLFSLNNLQNKNELIAIFVCGLSKKSFIFTIVQLSLFITILQFFNNAFVIPFAKKLEWMWIKESAIHFRENRTKNIQTTLFSDGKIWYKGKNYFASFSAFDKNKNELKEISFYFLDNAEDPQLIKIVEGEKSFHVKDYLWQIDEGIIFENLAGFGFPIIKKFEKLLITLGQNNEDFSRIDADIAQLSIQKLYAYIGTMKKLGIKAYEYEVMFYDQFSSSIICLIFGLSSLNALNHPNRRGRSFGRNVLFTMVFNLLYWSLHYTGLALGSSGKILPFFGTFLAPGFCTIYLLFFFLKNRKVT